MTKTFNATQAGLEYFKDLQSDPEAWRGWECLKNNGIWFVPASHINMLNVLGCFSEFRRKPKTVTVEFSINNSVPETVELPAPVREPLSAKSTYPTLYLEAGSDTYVMQFDTEDGRDRWFEFFISQAQE